MARTPTKTTPPAAEPALNETALATLEAAPRQLAVAHEAMDEVLAAGIDLGRLEALDFIAVTANTAALAVYQNVKKSKAWRLLKNPQSAVSANFQSLEEFCDVKLGKSYRSPPLTADQATPLLLRALRTLGQATDDSLTLATPREVLDWGIARWNAGLIPRTLTLAEAQLR